MTPEEELNALEADLAVTLKPIRPPSEFVHRLRGRIHIPSRAEFASRLRGSWSRMFLVFGGVMSGLLIVITVARALYYLSGRKSG